jgi:TrmH family RNA methyltransferase
MSEITKNQLKLIRSLQQKKYRKENNLFIVEGVKNIEELLKSNATINSIYATSDWKGFYEHKTNITNKELSQMSTLSTPDKVLALVQFPDQNLKTTSSLILVLDNINDPGNLGTIIRAADWFGVYQIICSENSVDCFNPKVVQATKGSIFRTNVIYTNLVDFFTSNKLPVYGATLKGTNLRESKLQDGVVLMGSESHGISDELMQFVTHEVSISKFGEAESLNVAIATSIILNEFKNG